MRETDCKPPLTLRICGREAGGVGSASVSGMALAYVHGSQQRQQASYLGDRIESVDEKIAGTHSTEHQEERAVQRPEPAEAPQLSLLSLTRGWEP